MGSNNPVNSYPKTRGILLVRKYAWERTRVSDRCVSTGQSSAAEVDSLGSTSLTAARCRAYLPLLVLRNLSTVRSSLAD
ncbi:hypothetical protein J6590_033821 [Homalodisca vitripennis]|nr:hypothetical protein J6590_033821 [Homalodisca vitripennis]